MNFCILLWQAELSFKRDIPLVLKLPSLVSKTMILKLSAWFLENKGFSPLSLCKRTFSNMNKLFAWIYHWCAQIGWLKLALTKRWQCRYWPDADLWIPTQGLTWLPPPLSSPLSKGMVGGMVGWLEGTTGLHRVTEGSQTFTTSPHLNAAQWVHFWERGHTPLHWCLY